MLRYIQDGAEKTIALQGRTTEEVANFVMEEALAAGRHVTNFIVNNIDAFENVEALDTATEAIESLTVETMSTAEMVEDTIRNSQAHIEALKEITSSAISAYRSGNDIEGHLALAGFADSMITLTDATQEVLTILNRAGRGVQAGRKIDARAAELAKTLTVLQEAQEGKDAGYVADILEYEILPLLPTWKDMLLNLEN